jgi:hypothetical protein
MLMASDLVLLPGWSLPTQVCSTTWWRNCRHTFVAVAG